MRLATSYTKQPRIHPEIANAASTESRLTDLPVSDVLGERARLNYLEAKARGLVALALEDERRRMASVPRVDGRRLGDPQRCAECGYPTDVGMLCARCDEAVGRMAEPDWDDKWEEREDALGDG